MRHLPALGIPAVIVLVLTAIPGASAEKERERPAPEEKEAEEPKGPSYRPQVDPADIQKAGPPTAGYAGVEACRDCHLEAWRVWTGAFHSRSFVSLGTWRARKVSVEPGAAPGMPSMKMMAECSPCHARGMSVPRKERGSFHPEDGVQCETCHGPGARHAEEASRKDPPPDSGAPLRIKGREICMGCHKEKPSHAVLGLPPFDIQAAWPKIEHNEHKEKRKEVER